MVDRFKSFSMGRTGFRVEDRLKSKFDIFGGQRGAIAELQILFQVERINCGSLDFPGFRQVSPDLRGRVEADQPAEKEGADPLSIGIGCEPRVELNRTGFNPDF